MTWWSWLLLVLAAQPVLVAGWDSPVRWHKAGRR